MTGITHQGDSESNTANQQQRSSGEEKAKIRVLLVDDQPLIRKGLRMQLGLEKDLEVVGEAENGERALEVVREIRPDVVVMDVEMPRMDGITAAFELHKLFPEVIVIMLSIHDSSGLRERARNAGAAAYVEKRNGTVALLREIRRAFAS